MPNNTPTSLLLYLAVANDWVSRRELAYLYRPDSSEAEALSYLRLQLHRAARYPWAQGLEIGKQQVRWLVTTDVAELRRHHADKCWQDVVSTYGGPFLSGLEDSGWPTFDSWLELEREACKLLYQEALRANAERLEATGSDSAALDAYRKLLAEDELDESALKRMMQVTAAVGRPAEALRQYERFRQLLLDEMGMEPENETVALAASLAAKVEKPVQPQTLGRQPAVQAVLPRATTKFVGREAELDQLAALLRTEDLRLLTLVGIGGTGKTRLATELARRNQRQFTGGVWFVPLVEVADWQGALKRIAAAIGLDSASEGELEAELGESFSAPSLLVLDNCEQVTGLSQLVSRLLASAEHLKVLATSRRTLELTAEHIYDVRGLKLPSATADTTVEDTDAARLFLGAARRVLPRLEPTEQEWQHIHHICQLVDGLPLALELASAWVRAMPLGRIALQLQQGFELLTTEQVDVAVRHRSVESVLQRTWTELTERKAATLAAMAVFQEGCTLEAAEEVTGGELPILLSLVNQSLLHRSVDGRFGSHPLVAQYAAKSLDADPELLRRTTEAHVNYYSELLLQFSPDRQGKDAPSLRVLRPDISNVEKAWFHHVTGGNTERLVQLVDSLLNYYTIIGQYRRGTEVGNRTLEALAGGDALACRVRCSIMLAQSNMARESGLLAEALKYAAAAKTEADRHQLIGMGARAHRFCGDVLQMMGSYDEAATEYEMAVPVFDQLGETAELANTLNSLASMDAVRERYEEATSRFEECVVLFEQVGDVLAKAIALNNLGYLADAVGQTELAAQRYEEGLADFERIQFTRGIAAVKNNLVVLYGSLGRLEEAEGAGLESIRLKADMEDRLGLVISLKNLGDLCNMREKPAEALDYYRPALKLAIEADAIPRLLQVLPGYAKALEQLGHKDDARAVRTALAQHPLTPPSARQSAREALPGLSDGVDEAAFNALAAQLEIELSEVATNF